MTIQMDCTNESSTSLSVEDLFDTSIFNDIVAAQEARSRKELAEEYRLFNERAKFVLVDDGSFDDGTLIARDASENIRNCSLISDSLRARNEEGAELLKGLEELIDDLLFRLETIHHPEREEGQQGLDQSQEEGKEVEDEYDEETAQNVITGLFSESAKSKSKIKKNINTCNATLSGLKCEISELMASNPRVRRASRNLGMLSRLTDRNNQLSGLANSLRRVSVAPSPPPIAEEFNPSGDLQPIVEDIMKFVKDQDLPEDESIPVINKIGALSKTIHHFKSEVKLSNQKSTEDQIKINNLQTRLPKLEESRVRLSQQCEKLKEEVSEKDGEITKLKLKIKTIESMANETLETLPQPPPEKSKNGLPKGKGKQAVIPKTVLKDVMQASDKEIEGKLNDLACSNEAIRVVLVRKNKQIRRLEGQITDLAAETGSLKVQVTKLEEGILAGTVDAESLRQEIKERVEAEAKERSGEEQGKEEEEQEQEDGEGEGEKEEEEEEEERVVAEDSHFTTVTSVAESPVCDDPIRAFIDNSTNTETEAVDCESQTDPPSPSSSPELEEMINLKRRGTRRRSTIVPELAPLRRLSVARPTDRRRSSAVQQDLFGIAAPTHHLTTSDLAAIEEFDKSNPHTEKSIRQVDDIAVLQKYIASMREQSEKGMEKVREFIAKEKTRNEATTRRLINEHEKILSNHKKEINKIVFSIRRFKDMVLEVLNGKELTQINVPTNFKFEQSPIQLRINSSEMLSSLEFEIYQTLKEKEMKIRDLSGRKRLDDRELDRRIKEREKSVFSMLDFTNNKLRKEKERVLKREQWVNKKIKTELQFEKQQESEVRTFEQALVRFWRKQNSVEEFHPSSAASPVPPAPDSSPAESTTTKEQRPSPSPRPSSEGNKQMEEFGFEALIPKLFISVADQRNNASLLDVARRAGQLSNLGHKIITNIIGRWLEIAEQKIISLFKAYIKYRRLTSIQVELMEQKEQTEDMERAMLLHRKIADLLDLQYKKLHVELGKLSKYSAEILEEEEEFLSSLPNHRTLKNIVRPAILHINHNAMVKKLMESVIPKKQEETTHYAHVTSSIHGSLDILPERIEEIAVTRRVARRKDAGGGSWRADAIMVENESLVRSLLVPRILQLDTARAVPVRLQKQPVQSSTGTATKASGLRTGLPPIPLYSPLKSSGISYIPNISSVWNYRRNDSNAKNEQ